MNQNLKFKSDEIKNFFFNTKFHYLKNYFFKMFKK